MVAYNSNTLTQSVLEGIPSFCFDPASMAAPVCLKPKVLGHQNLFHWSTDPESFLPSDKARGQWLNDLAYTQWTLDEIKNGAAWEHLKHAINAN